MRGKERSLKERRNRRHTTARRRAVENTNIHQCDRQRPESQELLERDRAIEVYYRSPAPSWPASYHCRCQRVKVTFGAAFLFEQPMSKWPPNNVCAQIVIYEFGISKCNSVYSSRPVRDWRDHRDRVHLSLQHLRLMCWFFGRASYRHRRPLRASPAIRPVKGSFWPSPFSLVRDCLRYAAIDGDGEVRAGGSGGRGTSACVGH